MADNDDTNIITPLVVDRVEVSLVGGDMDEDSCTTPLPAPFSLDDADDQDDTKCSNSSSNIPTNYSRAMMIQSVWKYLVAGRSRAKASASGAPSWQPSKIQQHLWSLLLMDSPWNTIGVAPTGSGKTLAYALPALVSTSVTTTGDDSSAVLVLVPTRELAQQVAKVFGGVCRAIAHVQKNRWDKKNNVAPASKSSTTMIPIVTVHGGANRHRQKEELEAAATAGRAVVVATPGRLLDLINGRNGGDDNTKGEPTRLLPVFQWIILDEADQLAKDGDLGPQVDEILEATKVSSLLSTPQRFVLVSATYPEKARPKFQAWVGKKYVLAQVDHHVQQQQSLAPKTGTSTDGDGKIEDTSETSKPDGDHSKSQHPNKNSGSFARIPSHLEQIVHVCSEHKKPRKLLHTLEQIYKKYPNPRSRPLGIVFFSKIEKLKHASKLLEKEGITGSVELHSQLAGSSKAREVNLAQFACGQKPLLLATDLAARGIDVPSVQFVIQYDFPGNLQQYVHRCGRAGRSWDDSSPPATTKTTQKQKPTVYSFFTRNLKAMAPDLIRLLEANQAWVDPNLRTLAQGDDGSSGKKPKKAQAKQETLPSWSKSQQEEVMSDEDAIDDFPELSANRIVLKRASHVSDASSSSSDEDSSDMDES